MKLTPRQIGIIIGGMVLLALGYWILNSNLKSASAPPEITLKVWGTDLSSYFDPILQQYQAMRPNVTITYQSISESGYDAKVLNTLASGDGPDVFVIGNHDLPKSVEKLAPADPTQMNITTLRSLFPTVVEQDSVSGSSSMIYALPLRIDTLSLIYNKDMLDAAGIVVPPANWSDFQADVQRLKSVDENGRVVVAGAAVGGTQSTISRAPDIIYSLMLQNNVAMTDSTFSTASFATDSGLEALNFYIRFADPTSAYFTWTDGLGTDREAMTNQKTAMMFGYYSDYLALKKKSPFINFAAAAFPVQEGGGKQVTYASYKEMAVSKQSKTPGWGWDFVIFATTNTAAQDAYQKLSGYPPALRASIAKNINDPELGVYARQALIARTWHEADPVQVDAAFNSAVQDTLSGRLDSSRALRAAQEKVTSLMK
ncbi:MAG: extracellular solute-binding protein [Candidatus Liptonbacteria bacterium]